MSDIPPIALSIIVCDRVLLDAPTKTSSIISIRNTIMAQKYPARHPQLFFFCELTNGRNTTDVSVRLIDVSGGEKTMAQRNAKVKFDDVKRIIVIAMGFEGIVFPHPGEYRFQIHAGQELLGERAVTCVQTQKPGTSS